jgi:hypothetical protein
VRILYDYQGAQPVFRHFCLEHAEDFQPFTGSAESGAGPQRLSVGSLMVMVGLFLGVTGAVGSWIGIGSSPGVGWLQLVGMGAGALFVLLGALIGMDAVEVIGAVVFGIAAGADLFGGEGAAETGSQQRLVLWTGIVLAGAGIGLRLGFGLKSSAKTPSQQDKP